MHDGNGYEIITMRPELLFEMWLYKRGEGLQVPSLVVYLFFEEKSVPRDKCIGFYV